MILIDSIKNLYSQMNNGKSHFIRVKHKFENGIYSVNCGDYTCKLVGSIIHSTYYLKVTNKEGKDVLEIHSKVFPQNQYSTYKKDGILTLNGMGTIVHHENRKIYFNRNLTKDKHFNYSLNYNMPSYENTQLIIKMKKYLQKNAYVQYIIDINEIDETKLSSCDLNLEYLRSLREYG